MGTLGRLALRNLLRHPWRSFATTLGIALGIAAVLTTLSVGDNVEANLRSTLQAAAGKADLLVTPGPSSRAVFDGEPLASQVAAVAGVTGVYPVLATRAEPLRQTEEVPRSLVPGLDSGFQLFGRFTEVEADIPAALSAGSYPTPGSLGIAIADGFALQRGIGVGSIVPFGTSGGQADLLVTGLLDDAVGVASTNGGRIGIMHLTDLENVLHLVGRVSYLEVQVASADLVEPVREQLELLAGPDYAVTYPATSGNFASGIVQTLQSGLSVLAATLLALGAFLAYNTFMASVVERGREYALLRTICMTRAGVLRLALYEAAALAACGVVLGIVLGIGLSYLITGLNAATLGYEFRTLVMPLDSVALASLLGVMAALLAGVLPAYNASNTPPMAAVQRTEPAPQRWHLWLGLGLLAAGATAALLPWSGPASLIGVAGALGLFFMGVSLVSPSLLVPALLLLRPLMVRLFGAPGRIGASFAQLSAARNGVAIGTVVVGAGLVIGVGSMVSSINRAVASWIDTTVIGDLFVTTPVSFPADFAARAQAVEGVDAASGVGIRVVRFMPGDDPRAGRSIVVVLVEPERFDPRTGFGRFQFVPGQGSNETAFAALTDGEAVLVANTMRDRHGAQTGSTISLRTTDGFRDFPVAGVVVDFTGGGETVVASIARLAEFGGGSPELFVLTIRPGQQPEVVRDRLLATFPELYLDATLNTDYRRYILDVSSQAFATTRVLLVIAVLVAALGVTNTLGMNLVNRGHEIAVLRTLGLSRAGVQSMVTAEGVLVTLIGGLLGAGFGLLLARVVTAGAGTVTGFILDPVIPWSLALLSLAASPLAGLVASLLPARRAATLAPSRALASWSEHV